MSNNPILCAIDTNDLQRAKELAQILAGQVGGIKLGLEFFTKFGQAGVREVIGSNDEIPLFLDLKFHDIPNTVAGAVRSSVNIGAFMLTVHASGGSDMLKAAVDAAGEEAHRIGVQPPMIIAVTVLTSMDKANLHEIGVDSDVKSHVLRLGEIAQKAGVDGLVCSAHEIGVIRSHLGNDIKLIVPGIRPITSNINDQKRVMTPKLAIADGADYLVIGRPITQSDDPTQAAADILKSI